MVTKKDSDVPGATRDSTWGMGALGWLGTRGLYGLGFRNKVSEIVPSAQ